MFGLAENYIYSPHKSFMSPFFLKKKSLQAFREYYPSSNDARTFLECVWVKDKFVLHENTKGNCEKTQAEDQKSCASESAVLYETLGQVSEGWNAIFSVLHDIFINTLVSWLHSWNIYKCPWHVVLHGIMMYISMAFNF